MKRMNSTHETNGLSRTDRPAIFGLRYLEEEAAEVQDVVGCLLYVSAIRNNGSFTGTGCDDHDQIVLA